MDFLDDPVTRIEPPPLPQAGLEEVFSAWAGEGGIWNALAAIEDPLIRRWAPRDAEIRANRLFLEVVRGKLESIPTSLSVWVDALPAEIVRLRVEADAPFAGVSWSETRRRFGWPPQRFHGQSRTRASDSLLATSLRWVIEEVLAIALDAEKAVRGVTTSVDAQLALFSKLMLTEPIASSSAIEPGPPEFAAMRYEGAPWTSIAVLGEELVSWRRSPSRAIRFLAPDADFRWRLFHLGVLGGLIVALRAGSFPISSLRPLAGNFAGPAYEVIDGRGRRWDLWFEAAGAWRYYGLRSLYLDVASSVPAVARPLGADIMIARQPDSAIIVECKYSWSSQVVARTGYSQCLAYMVEARSRLAESVNGFVVGPEGVVGEGVAWQTHVGSIAIVSPDRLGEAVLRQMQ